MVCEHLEQLAVDIKNQGIREKPPGHDEIEDNYESVYFDCYLDSKSIRQKYNFPDFIKDHIFQGTDDTLKEGFVCETCNQAVLGLHQSFLPGCKTFGYNESGQAHALHSENGNANEDTVIDEDEEKPIKEKKKRYGFASIVFAVFLGVPIALYQYLPQNMMLGFIAGICALIAVPLILSPIIQKIRGKDRYRFPFASIFIILLIGASVFVLYGWRPLYYVLGGYAVLLFFGSILSRLMK